MARLPLFLLVAIGLSVCGCLGSSSPCAPDTYSANFTLVMGGQDSLGEKGDMQIDYLNKALSANVSGMTGSLDTFSGRFLWINSSGWWIQTNVCYSINQVVGTTPEFSQRCMPDGGNFTQKTVANVDSTIWSYGNESISMAYIYTTADQIPINFQMFQYATSTSLANITGLVYLNPGTTVDPSSFVVPDICVGPEKKIKTLSFLDIPALRTIKTLLWNF